MSPTPNPLKGLALVLVLVGIVLATAGAVGAMVTGNQRLMFAAALGFALQFAGWHRHNARTGGRS
ncbi:hypothetical protein [Streptomyces sp. HNM0574]|uniref:hypothetical protein n=1 Tax=Streptomyces sp. HNM0574 TaxID=2714954 RepID=UPI00146CD6B4|nr:hypothetical protein [Streptomyces sp. HNM0574]NLU68481.1 hypothetical protein [Streptomyces sp. HNM0574]